MLVPNAEGRDGDHGRVIGGARRLREGERWVCGSQLEDSMNRVLVPRCPATLALAAGVAPATHTLATRVMLLPLGDAAAPTWVRRGALLSRPWALVFWGGSATPAWLLGSAYHAGLCGSDQASLDHLRSLPHQLWPLGSFPQIRYREISPEIGSFPHTFPPESSPGIKSFPPIRKAHKGALQHQPWSSGSLAG